MPRAEESPWQREARRLRPTAPRPHAVLGEEHIVDEPDLRAHLAVIGYAPAIIERAVARAKAWPDLTPFERALLDLLTGAPVELAAMLVEVQLGLPESWQAQLSGFHAEVELGVTLVSLRERGLVQCEGLDGPWGETIALWGTFTEEERRESYAGRGALQTGRPS